jgi:cysteine desulfurase/selenocysteine lyase
VVYGKEELLNETQPWQGGGNMIEDVTFEHTRFQKSPARYEAGTGNIADAVGLGAAIDYVMRLGIDWINQYEHFLLEYALAKLKHVPGLKFIGMPHHRAGVISLWKAVNRRCGCCAEQTRHCSAFRHHCAQPILRRLGVESGKAICCTQYLQRY